VIAREQKMVLKNMRLERSKANGMIVVFILFAWCLFFLDL